MSSGLWVPDGVFLDLVAEFSGFDGGGIDRNPRGRRNRSLLLRVKRLVGNRK